MTKAKHRLAQIIGERFRYELEEALTSKSLSPENTVKSVDEAVVKTKKATKKFVKEEFEFLNHPPFETKKKMYA